MNSLKSGATAPSLFVLYSLLFIGVFSCSLSVIFIKSSTTHPFWLSGTRLLIAAVALFPLYLIEVRKLPSFGVGSIVPAWPGAVALAMHFVLWTLGARMTQAANASLIVNLTPVVMPIAMWFLNRERINRTELIGTIVAMIGVVLLIITHYHADPQNMRGDMVCFAALVLFCIYLALGRKRGMDKNLWLYVVPLYTMAGLLCWGIAIATHAPAPVLARHEVILLLSLGLVPTVIGHSIMNWCIRHMRGQIVSTANLCQFLFAGAIAFICFGDHPDAWFYPTTILIVIGAAIVIRANKKTVDVDAES